MRNTFTTGMILGSMIGATAAMMMDMDNRSRKKTRKNRKRMMTKAGNIVGDLVEIMK